MVCECSQSKSGIVGIVNELIRAKQLPVKTKEKVGNDVFVYHKQS